MTIEAVLWDFGGVLTSSPFEAFNRFEEEQGLPRDFIRGVNAMNPQTNAWSQFESDQVSLEVFDQLFSDESAKQGHRVSGKDVVALLGGEVRPRMVTALRACKTRYRVGCITNNVRAGHGPSMALDEGLATRMAEVMALFDVVIESSVEGVRKPDPEIYAIACERLGVAPENVIFLDDLGINLKPARAMGMRTIKVVSESQALDELSQMTSLELRY